MANCPKCNAAVGADDRFCGSCGQALQGAPTQPPQAAPPPVLPTMASAQNKKLAPWMWIGAALAVVLIIFGGRHFRSTSKPTNSSTPVQSGTVTSVDTSENIPGSLPDGAVITRSTDSKIAPTAPPLGPLKPGQRISTLQKPEESTATRETEPAIDLASQLVGKWKGGRHTTQYFADGTLIVDPDITPQPIRESVATWRIQGDQLITVQARQTFTYTIVSLTDSELVLQNEHGTFRLRRVD